MDPIDRDWASEMVQEEKEKLQQQRDQAWEGLKSTFPADMTDKKVEQELSELREFMSMPGNKDNPPEAQAVAAENFLGAEFKGKGSAILEGLEEVNRVDLKISALDQGTTPEDLAAQNKQKPPGMGR